MRNRPRRRPAIIAAIICLAFAGIAATALALVASNGHDTAKPRTPGKVLNLKNWKLTLPISGEDGPEEPAEVKQPQLNTYQSRFFHLNDARDGVVFRATAGGKTTQGTDFARTELREMTSHGTQKAAWSTDRGQRHSMTITQAITHLPPGRPAIVAGQIHGPDSEYVALVRLDGQRMYVKTEQGAVADLDTGYKLGTTYTLRLEATGSRIKIYYNGALKSTLERSCNECYFKAGAYLQTNTQWDNPQSYGEVTIYRLKVEHSTAR